MKSTTAIIRTSVGIATVFSVACLIATEGVALQIDPRCKTFSDKLGCTCALQNGGYIVYGARTRWASARQTTSGRPTNQAFTQCIINHGGR